MHAGTLFLLIARIGCMHMQLVTLFVSDATLPLIFVDKLPSFVPNMGKLATNSVSETKP